MIPQEFDNIVREKIKDIEFTPPHDGWDRIASQINRSPETNTSDEEQKPLLWTWSRMLTRIAATLLIAISSVGLWKYWNTKTDHPITQENTTSTHQKADDKISPPVQSESILQNSNKQNLNSHEIPSSSPTSNTNSIAFDNSKNNYESLKINNVKTPDIPIASIPLPQKNNSTNDFNNIVSNEPEKEIKESPQTIPSTNSSSNTITQNKEINSPQENKKELPAYFHTDPIPTQKSNWNNKAIAMQIGSSMINANPQAAAIQLGVSNTSNINGRLYADISVSYVNNNPAFIQSNLSRDLSATSGIQSNTIKLNSSDLDAYGVDPNNNTFRAGGNIINVNDLQTDTAVILAMASRIASGQVQALPMLGLNISKKLRMAAGVDANKIFATQKFNEAVEKLSLFTQEPVVMRKWDAGISAKAEAKITKRISIGYRQRIGLTNLVRNSVGTSTRRNYSDLVLRFNLK